MYPGPGLTRLTNRPTESPQSGSKVIMYTLLSFHNFSIFHGVFQILEVVSRSYRGKFSCGEMIFDSKDTQLKFYCFFTLVISWPGERQAVIYYKRKN